MHIDMSPDIRAGTIFRIDDIYDLGLFPTLTKPYAGETKVGDTMHLLADNNNR